MRHPVRVIVVLAVMVPAALAPAAVDVEQLDFDIAGGAEISPRYECAPKLENDICRTATELTTPRRVSTAIKQVGDPTEGTLHIIYNQYRFDGRIAFRAGDEAVGASGTGYADAAWDMVFADDSRLWGTVSTTKLHLGFDGAREAVVFEIAFLIRIAGGSGRYEGLTSDCPAAGCTWEQRVVTPHLRESDIPGGVRRAVAQAAVTMSDLELAVEPGEPDALVALPRGGRLVRGDERRLQVSVQAGSDCIATARGLNQSAIRAADPIKLGAVKAGRRDSAVFPGALRRRLARSAPRVADSRRPGYRLRVGCETPDGDHVVDVRDVVLATSGQGR